MGSKRFIHIGANKTASTTLQRSLFSKMEQIQYFGEDGIGYDSVMEDIWSLMNDDDFHYDGQKLAAIFYEQRARGDGRPFVFSNEDIMRSRVPSLCAHRLYTLIPDAEIVVVIRNQLTAVPSWYVNHGAFLRDVPGSYWRRYVSFDDWMSYCTRFLKYSPLDGFFYEEIIRLYEDIFGNGRVHVFLFEEFVRDRDVFLQKFCRALGVDWRQASQLLAGRHERKRLTQRQFNAHKWREILLCGRTFPLLAHSTWLASKWRTFLEFGSPVRHYTSDEWRNKIIGLYATGNRRLADRHRLPLEELGYPLSK